MDETKDSPIQRLPDGQWMRVDTGQTFRTWTEAYLSLRGEQKNE